MDRFAESSALGAIKREASGVFVGLGSPNGFLIHHGMLKAELAVNLNRCPVMTCVQLLDD